MASSSAPPRFTGASPTPIPAPSTSAARPTPTKEPPSQTALFFVAGGLAGAVSRTVVAPLERIKILYQVQGSELGGRAYNGLGASLVKIWSEEGIRGMFKGNGVNCVRIAPYSAVQFTAYEQFKKLFTQGGRRELDTPLRLSAGALAGICSVCSTYPLDLIRSRLSIATAQIGKGKSSIYTAEDLTIGGMTRKVFREEGGLRGLYRGVAMTALGVAPYVGINFAAYEALRGFSIPPGDSQPSTLRKLGCGALAGSISQTLTYPIDVLRRKMQVIGVKALGLEYNTAWGAVTHMWRTEGVIGFYRGLTINLAKVAPAIGSSFVVYEATKNALGAV